MPLSVIGRSMTWGEAIRLTHQLGRDTASHVFASIAEWDYPATREALVAMDHYDAYAKATFKRPKPYPRPWPDRTKSRPKPTISQEEVIAALRMAGHTGPLPWQTDEEAAAELLAYDANGRLHDERGRFLPHPDQPEVEVPRGV